MSHCLEVARVPNNIELYILTKYFFETKNKNIKK